MSTSRPPGYGGEAQAIRKGAAMLQAAELGVGGDRLRLTLPGTRVTSGRGPRIGETFAPTSTASAGPGDPNRPACENVHAELFVADDNDPQRIGEAKAVCRACPRRLDCLEDGAATLAHGIWGGLTQRERRALARRPGGNWRLGQVAR